MNRRSAFVFGAVMMGLMSLTSGCSVYMAATKPPWKDVNILHPGTPRDAVIAEFGTPQLSRTNPEGLLEEMWTFRQGESTGWKVSRVLFHAAADLFTLCLWEIVATPTEMMLQKDEQTFMVTFDSQQHIQDVRYLTKGGT